MRFRIKIFVFLISTSALFWSCRKRCKSFDPSGSYTASVSCSWSKWGGYPAVTPSSWDTSYTDVLVVACAESAQDIAIQNFPAWDYSSLEKTTKKYTLKRGDSDQSNEETDPKECFDNAYAKPYVSNGSESLVIGKGSFKYSLSVTYGGSAGHITKYCTIIANR